MGAVGKLFKNGRSQAVRIPAKYRFEGAEVDFRPGPLPGEVILSPRTLTGESGWDEFFRVRDELMASPELAEDFLMDREQGPAQRDDLFDDL